MNLEFAMYGYNVVVSDVQYEKVGGSYDYDAPSDMDYAGYEDLLGFNIDSIHDLQNKGKMLDPKEEGEFISEYYQEIYDTILKLCRAWHTEDKEEGVSVSDNYMDSFFDKLPKTSLEQLEKSAARYEYVRRLDPNKFAELWWQNVRLGVPFDTLVDEAIERESLC